MAEAPEEAPAPSPSPTPVVVQRYVRFRGSEARAVEEPVIAEMRLRIEVDGESLVELMCSPHRVNALVLECNHDIAMLASGRYPDSLKARVGGNWGHLNNRQAAGLLASLERNRLQHLVAAHLSRENNAPALVAEALAPVLDGYDATMTIACQDDGFGWMELD